MAITPLGEEYKKFTFDGEDSTSFGVQILGEGTFNAPKRVVESVNVPGRSGAILIDQGYYENITVTYPARLIADSTEDFADAISDFRNFLCSRKGYCRLQDDYNPDEYRLASYTEGLEADVDVLKAGKFDITFDCKPQRYLTSGETEITAISQILEATNPTPYSAKPLLKVEGYGEIQFPNTTIIVGNAPLGLIMLAKGRTNNTLGSNPAGIGQSFWNAGYLNVNDEILCNGIYVSADIATSVPTSNIGNAAVTSTTNVKYAAINKGNQNQIRLVVAVDDFSFHKGTSLTKTATVGFSYSINGTSYTNTLTISARYDSPENIGYSYTLANTDGGTYFMTQVAPNVYGISSKMSSDYTAHIDLDSGQAYIDSHLPISLNRTIVLPTDLPGLEPGLNILSCESTITSFKLIPRWWKL